MQDVEQAIRERAYYLCIEGGCQEGQAQLHWLAAQRSILGALLDASEVGELAAKPKKASSPQKRRVA